jgi:excisionase family DNA binding protein
MGEQMDRLLLRPAEAAEVLGISRGKCYQLIAERRLPSIKVGKSTRVPAQALREWIAAELETQSAQSVA